MLLMNSISMMGNRSVPDVAEEGKISDLLDLAKEAKKMISDGIMSGTLIPEWNEAFDERKKAYEKLVEMKKELDNSSLTDEEKKEKNKEYADKVKEYRSLVNTEQKCRKLLNKALEKRDHTRIPKQFRFLYSFYSREALLTPKALLFSVH